MDTQGLSLLSAAFLAWVAIVHVVLALGVRQGELVWSGRRPGRLLPEARWHSGFYAVFLVLSAFVLVALGGLVEFYFVPHRWHRSAGFVVTALLGVASLLSFGWGSTWERILFGPMTLLGAGLAGYLTFG